MAIEKWWWGLWAVYLWDTLIAGWGWGGGDYWEWHCIISAGAALNMSSWASFCVDGNCSCICWYKFLLLSFKHQNYRCSFAWWAVLDSNKCIYHIPWVNHCWYYNCAWLFSYNGDCWVWYITEPYYSTCTTWRYYNVTSVTTGQNIQGSTKPIPLTAICKQGFSYRCSWSSWGYCLFDWVNAATCLRWVCNSPCIAAFWCSRTSNY